MNSLFRVFNNFREFYSEINGATLTGAIDVVVVEQPNGEFLCSPFHVRFGKLGVLRSREKIVDIEINGEPVDIHMKLGDSGEAFFVEECPKEEIEELPENLATSPISTYELNKYEEKKDYTETYDEISLPMLRRNSISCSKTHNDENKENKFENQVSDFSNRRHTDNFLDRKKLSNTTKEYMIQKIHQGWLESEDKLQELDSLEKIKKKWINTSLKTETKQKKKMKKSRAEKDKIKQLRNIRKIVEQEDKLVIKENYMKTIESVKVKNETYTNAKKESKLKRKRRKKSQQKSIQDAQCEISSNISTGNLQTEQRQESNTLLLKSTKESLNHESSMEVNKTLLNYDDKKSKEDYTGDYEEQHQEDDKPTTNRLRDIDILVFSDTEIVSTRLSPRCSRLVTPIQSDSELEISQREKNKGSDIMTNSTSWKWGELPQSEKHKDIAQVQQHNSMLGGMFNFMKKSNKMRKNSTTEDGVYLSELNAERMNPEMVALYFPPNKDRSLNIPPDRDCENKNFNENLDSDYEAEKREKRYSNFVAMSPRESIKKENELIEEESGHHVLKYCSESIERLMNTEDCSSVSSVDTNTISTDNLTTDPIQETKYGHSWWYWRRSEGDKYNHKDIEDKAMTNVSVIDNRKFLSTQKVTETLLNSKNLKEKYRKTLRLSSKLIESLNLKPGINEIEFSVTTAYQGTSRCKCYLFRWKYNDKVVISDIDGTITKSDVLGHILPMMGKDWAQIGVAQLFSKIEANGYKILYLSARAIGQSRVTREYLRSIRQGDVKLPDGPLLLNPTSLISAFHREVIERKPEQFKIACLTDIQALFPENPFYAGYGNRINDVWAYRAVGIPIMRIFTINTKGQLKHELTQTFQSSYTHQSLEVNEIFPPFTHQVDGDTDKEKSADEFQFYQAQDDNDNDIDDTNEINQYIVI